MNTDHITCKSCGKTGHIEVLPRVRDVNPFCLLLGAVVLPLLWCAGRKTELRCVHCNSRLSARDAKACVALGVFWVLVFVLATVVVTFLVTD